MSDQSPDALERLTEIFRRYGVDRPELWATSQIKEGIPQFGRFVFLREAWNKVVHEDNDQWIEGLINSTEQPEQPEASAGFALQRMLAQGVARQDITDLVRWMQYQMLFDLCYQLDYSAPLNSDMEDIVDHNDLPVRWGLFAIDTEDNPTQILGGLHESVLSLDPTGREMRPRGVIP